MNPYYVYALKDPRTSPARPFYIGKGTGDRAWEHALKPDGTRKGRRIEDIQKSGYEILTTIIADDLTETQALKIEAELISALGTEDTGGILTNSVIPAGITRNVRDELVIPSGVVEKAQIGLDLLKSAVFELALANPGGIKNADAAKSLGLQSSYGTGSKDYLSWSVLGLLMRDGKITRIAGTKKHRAVTR